MKANLDKDLIVKNLARRTEQYYCMSDDKKEKGFGVLVYPTGAKTFIFKYKIDGVQKLLKLGEYPAFSLANARNEYVKASTKVKDLRKGSADGLDPVKEKKLKSERRIAEALEYKRHPTVATLVSDYIERHAKRHKRSWKKDEQILAREVVGRDITIWGNLKAKDIEKRDVIDLLEKIISRPAPAMANNTFQIIRKMFNWAVEQDILKISPCIAIKKLPAPKNERDRVLSEAEIKTLMASLDRTDLNMSIDVRRCLKLILLTAQRPGEVIGMHAKEIDGNWWTIPAERAKNGKAQRVYLTATALELIGDTKDKGYIFQTPLKVIDKNNDIPAKKRKKKDKPIGDTVLAIAVGRNLAYPLKDGKEKPLYNKEGKVATENRLGVKHFTPHDLRRTAATFMSQLGQMDEVIDAVLNHKKQGIIKVYNLNKYDREKQQALESWERKLNSIIGDSSGNNVININRKKAA